MTALLAHERPVILSREDGEGSQDAQPKILRYAQDDEAVRRGFRAAEERRG
jgi:hypothetical protein